MTKLPCYPHRRSNTVSLETFTLYQSVSLSVYVRYLTVRGAWRNVTRFALQRKLSIYLPFYLPFCLSVCLPTLSKVCKPALFDGPRCEKKCDSICSSEAFGPLPSWCEYSISAVPKIMFIVNCITPETLNTHKNTHYVHSRPSQMSSVSFKTGRSANSKTMQRLLEDY